MARTRLVMAFILASIDVGGQFWLAAHGQSIPDSTGIAALIALFLTAGKARAK